MNALILPGNSPRHGEWVEQLKAALLGYFETIQTQHYRHWETGERSAEVDYELGITKRLTAGFEPYVLIGKSIGTVIAAKGTAAGLLHPEKLILLGLPVNGGGPITSFQQWLGQVDVPVIIAQNTADPLGAFADVKAGLGNVKLAVVETKNGAYRAANGSISFVELPGDTHDYIDFEAIAALM